MENSETFERAYSAAGYDLDLAISLYDREIEENPKNYAAWNNRGLCKVEKGESENSLELLKEGRTEIEMAIKLADDENKDYQVAKDNLVYTDKIIAELS